MLGLGLSFTSPAIIGGAAAPPADLLAGAGSFASSAGWTLQTGWTISGGVATKTAGTAGALLYTIAPAVGVSYLVTYTITVWVGGGLTPRFVGGTTVSGTARAAAGTFTDTLVALTGNNQISMLGNTTFAGTIDNLTIFPI